MKITRKQIALDTNKRHLVVGDLHGRWLTFQTLLDWVNYDPAKDIIYSTGDLIDRGIHSVEVIKFFQQPNTHAVLGNHEHMAITEEWYGTWVANGGDTCLDSLEQHGLKYDWLKKFIQTLPLMLDVGSSNDPNAFRIVHADLPPDWTEQMIDVAFEQPDKCPKAIDTMLWSRSTHKLYTTHRKHKDPQLPPCRTRTTILGHTAGHNLPVVGNMHFIDHCSELTIMDALTKEKVSLKHFDEDYPK